MPVETAPKQHVNWGSAALVCSEGLTNATLPPTTRPNEPRRLVNVSVPDTDRTIPWLVCPGRDRWLRAVRCFAGEMISTPSALAIQSTDPAETCHQLLGRCQAVVLWNVSTEHLGSWCTWITKTAIASPQTLQLAATTNLSVAEQAILSELGIVAMIRHPEQLPALGNLIRKYLATAGDRSRQSGTHP